MAGSLNRVVEMTGGQKLAFWRKVVVGGPGDCWEWKGAKKPKGYGNVRVNKAYLLAHRVAWIVSHGQIGEGLVVCHRCDNPSCCNPSHLFLGTIRDNTQDMIAKGRSKMGVNTGKGASHNMAKLSPREVQAIRNLYKNSSMSQGELAREFSISQTYVGRLVNGSHWSDFI